MPKGPWEENSMWTPDLQDSELANKCLKCQQLEKELQVERHLARHLLALLNPPTWKCFPNCVHCSANTANMST
jgi:hypothetical protein